MGSCESMGHLCQRTLQLKEHVCLIYIYIYVYVCIYIYVYIYVYIYICVYIYIFIYYILYGTCFHGLFWLAHIFTMQLIGV